VQSGRDAVKGVPPRRVSDSGPAERGESDHDVAERLIGRFIANGADYTALRKTQHEQEVNATNQWGQQVSSRARLTIRPNRRRRRATT